MWRALLISFQMETFMKNQKKLDISKLIAYSAGAGAAIAIAPNAFADIQHNTINETFDEHDSYNLEMEGGNAEFCFRGATSFMFRTNQFLVSSIADDGKIYTNPDSFAVPLGTGNVIGPATNNPKGANGIFYTFSGSGGAKRGYWENDNDIHYIGVSFNKEAGGEVYGWIKVQRLSKSSGKVISWGYQDDGTKIHAGALPEPATGLALLALGAAGIAAYRRR